MAAFAIASSEVHATALWEFSSPAEDTTNNTWDFGEGFSTSQSVTVTALGYFDDGGFTGSHEVALYSSTGVLIAEATVTSSDPVIGNFAYASITPVTIAAGSYEIDGVSGADGYTWNDPGFSTAPGITILYNTWEIGTSPLFQGTVQDDVADGYWGADALFSATPEPAAWALMIVGFLGLGAALRIRQRLTLA